MEMQIRASLNKWKDNEMQLEPAAQSSAMVQEVVPVSQNLSALASAGLQALEYLDRGEKAPDAWKTQQIALAQSAIQPKAQVLLMIASPVQKLVQASAGDKPTDLPIPKSD
jgi:hexosaminidase